MSLVCPVFTRRHIRLMLQTIYCRPYTPAVTVAAGTSSGWLAGLALVIDKARGGIEYTVASVTAGPRGMEISLIPTGNQRIRPQHAGQFVFLTATAGGHAETHPFTLTSAEGDTQLSMYIRDSGDWTHDAQTDMRPGDTVRLSGPFGAFTPTQANPSAPQVWVAGGAGIAPFLATIRTWRETGRTAPVRLVYSARTLADAPAWEEVNHAAQTLPWLSIEPVFTQDGDRIDGELVTRLDADAALADALWYVCGPDGLKATVFGSLRHADHPVSDLHAEEYSWRGVPDSYRSGPLPRSLSRPGL